MACNAYKLIIFGFISTIGSSVFSFACAFHILKNTENSYLYSIYLTLIVITTILSTPISGVFIDSVNNKRLILYSQLSSVAALIIFSLLYDDNVYMIICLGLLLTVPDGINSVIIQKNLQRIVTDNLERVISIRQTVSTLTSFVSPIIGGIVIAFIPLQVIGMMNMLTKAISIILIQSLPIINHQQMKSQFVHSFKEGVQYLVKKKEIMTFLVCAMLNNFLINVIVVGVPIIAIQQLHLKSTQFGMIESGYTIALFLVSFVMSIYPVKRGVTLFYKIGILIEIVTLFSLGVFLLYPHQNLTSFTFLIATYMLIGVSLPIINTPYGVYLQKAVEDEYKGRVFSLNSSIAQAIIPVSLSFFGFILNDNAAQVFMIDAILMLVVLTGFSIAMRKYQFDKYLKILKRSKCERWFSQVCSF
ncbi:MFS transporter [Staphylococcus pseudintermedius]|uniref:MFS transporter n=1 Tax=Staphylococcus pseudintermedius TaxID=283734 RepID=UPI002884923B|nr:MFS transporter [Staphylococcus pseudintermedius]MDT0918168.1 MFS transporter [Staphylococcus pseudintermedius]